MMRSPVTATLCLLLGACAGVEQPARRLPTVTAVQVTPASVTAGAGEKIRLQATVLGDSGVSQEVVWSAPTTLSVSVSSDGMLSTCYPGGGFSVSATSMADPAKSVVVPVTISLPLDLWTGIREIVRVGAPSPVRDPSDRIPWDNVTGSVEIGIFMHPAGRLACRKVESYVIELVGASQSFQLPTRTFEVPSLNSYSERRPFDSRTVPNGTYQAKLRIKVSEIAQELVMGSITLTIRNP